MVKRILFPLSSYIWAVRIMALVIGAALYLTHIHCQQQAKDVQAYMQSHEYLQDRAAYMQRIGVIK